MLDEELRRKLRELLKSAALKIDRESFYQEPQFTSAFFGKLHDEEVSNSMGQYVRLKFSASNDRGPGTAESLTGIDVGMVFEWTDSNGIDFQKAVLLQAKNNLMKLNATEQDSLQQQCAKMKKITTSYVVMDCPYDRSIPTVFNSQTEPPLWEPPPVPLDEFLIDHVLACERGDANAEVVQIARRADRRLIVQTNTPTPAPSRKRGRPGPK